MLEVNRPLFEVTEDDIVVLPKEEFDEVWKALGKVVIARATARRRRTNENPNWR